MDKSQGSGLTQRAAALLALAGLGLAAPPAHASFPGRNGALVYVDTSESSYDFGPLFRMRSDGRHRRKLRCRVAPLTSCVGQDPTFSPRGRSLAFVSSTSELMTSRADGTRRRLLTTSDELLFFHPAWSPRGRSLLYEGQPGNFEDSPSVYKVSARGGRPRELIRNAGSPSFSGRGRIAFARDRDPDRPDEVWTARANGTGQRLVTRGQEPAWSPRARRLAFVRLSDVHGESGLFTVRPDGRGLKRLTSSGANAPAWSPDGRRIAFVATSGGFSRVHVIAAAGGKVRTIGPRASRDPDWQPRRR